MKRVRLGVIGCGAIAQVQHLPNLAMLAEEFEVTVVCDLSPSLARYVADWFHIPRHVTDYREVMASDDVDAVLLLHTNPKAEVAVDAFNAGKHVFLEKPICTSLQQADAMIAAARRSGKVGMAGYMKVYDPAFEVAQTEVAAMDDIRFVQVNHLHTDNNLHLNNFRVKHFDDLPGGLSDEARDYRKAEKFDALGEAPPEVEQAHGMAASMIHDVYSLRHMVGMPKTVVSTEVWSESRSMTFILEYPNGARGVVSRVELPYLWDFKQTLEVYGDSKRVILSVPTGFSRGIPSELTVQAIDENGGTFSKEPAVPWHTSFSQELRHFHACITEGIQCRTSLEEARQDVSLTIDIAKAFMTGRPVPVER